MPRGRKPGSTNKPKTNTTTPKVKIERVPVAESETVVNLMGDSKVVYIGSNNPYILKELQAIKPPDKVMEGGFCSFTFPLSQYNFNIVPKRKRQKAK